MGRADRAIQEITGLDNFYNLTEKVGEGTLVILVFFKEICNLSLSMLSMLRDNYSEIQRDCNYLLLSVDVGVEVNLDICRNFSASVMPTVIFLLNGEEVEKLERFVTFEVFKKKVDAVLAPRL